MFEVNIKVKLLLITAALLILFFNACQTINTPPGTADSSAVSPGGITFSKMLEQPYAEFNLNRGQMKGKKLFDHYCAVCHGSTGDGNGFNAFNLESSFNVKPFNFSDSAAMAVLTDEELTSVISTGGTALHKSQYMPPWGYTLNKMEIRQIIAYIRTLSRSSGSEE